MIELIFLLLLHSGQDHIHSIIQLVWFLKVDWMVIKWIDLPNLTTFETGENSFSETTSLNLSSSFEWLLTDMIFLLLLHSIREIIHSITYQVWFWKVNWLDINWFDLPKLTNFTTGGYWSFRETTSVILSSILNEYWLTGSSFSYYIHYRRDVIWRNKKFDFGK